METWWQHFKRDQPKDNNEQETPRIPGGKKKKEHPPEPDTRSDFSETPHTAEPETGSRHEDAPEHETEPHEQTRGFGDLFEELSRSPDLAGMDDIAKKIWLKAHLRQIKYDIQGSDYDRVKAKTDQGKPTPWRTNREWNKISKTGKEGKPIMRFWRHEGAYKTAWRDVRHWAQKNKVWDQNDEREFIKETGGRAWTRRETAKNTARNVGLNVAVGGLYGVGYAIAAPWKGFELALKTVLPYFLEDHETTKKMMESMFGKEREKQGKGKEKKEEWNKAKEHEVKIKVKQIEIDYIKGLEGSIKEQKVKETMTQEAYATLTEERKRELEDNIGKRGYANVWRTLRVHWIQEGVWTELNEEEFRGVIEGKLIFRDLLTQQEYDQFEKGRKKQKKLEEDHLADPDNEDIKGSLEKIIGEMADMRNRMKIRKDTMRWPQYKIGKKKGGVSAEDFVTTQNDAEEDEDEDDTN